MNRRDEATERQIQSQLDASYFRRLKGIRTVCLSEVDSTQDYLSKVLKSEHEGDLVIAEIQTRGKGRQGRPWVSEKGGLYLSITLTPERQDISDKLALMASNSVLETLEKDYSLENCRTKLPNDVYCRGRKIAGVLVDVLIKGSSTIAYVGIGVNLNNDPSKHEEIAEIATSYLNETGRIVSLEDFVVALLGRLEANYSSLIEAGP